MKLSGMSFHHHDKDAAGLAARNLKHIVMDLADASHGLSVRENES